MMQNAVVTAEFLPWDRIMNHYWPIKITIDFVIFFVMITQAAQEDGYLEHACMKDENHTNA